MLYSAVLFEGAPLYYATVNYPLIRLALGSNIIYLASVFSHVTSVSYWLVVAILLMKG